MFLSPVLEKEVTYIINGLDVTKKSPGYDDMSPKTVIFVCNDIAHHLTYIMNQSLLTGIVPVKLKVAKVIPVFKKGDRSVMSKL